jgi:hypothetical protein
MKGGAMRAPLITAVCLLVGGIIAAGYDRIPGFAPYDLRVGKALLLDTMYDAESARLRHVKRHAAVLKDSPSPVSICGEVNGKNHMGAYVGFQRFVVELKDKSVEIDPLVKTTQADIEKKLKQCHAYAAAGYGELMEQCYDEEQESNEGQLKQVLFEARWIVDCALPEKRGI